MPVSDTNPFPCNRYSEIAGMARSYNIALLQKRIKVVAPVI
jgi:hypothetical protein